MFRQMVHGFRLTDALNQLKTEGAIHLYRGILPPLLQKSTSSAIMFGTYSQYTRIITNLLGTNNQVILTDCVSKINADVLLFASRDPIVEISRLWQLSCRVVQKPP